ncbi:MAG: glutamine-synthetase adenylyltransferase, partial [Pseudomonadota bacterium]
DLEIAAIDGDPKPALRRAKRRAAILVGLADLGGIWPVMEATRAWTDLADAMLDRALRHGVARHAGAIAGDCASLVAIAMGKMGAHELNYSSDIDLVLLFDESQHNPEDYGAVRAKLLKAARLAMATLSDVTGDGYVFRTDLRLRPDPSSTPIVLSMEAAERYFEAMGRTWERAAWIKARAAAGDIAAGTRFLKQLTPFVWRKHLDFAVVQDAHDMRLRIRDHKALHGAWDVPGHHVKLGHGGIREIEFFTQTRQIIAGGRDPRLRVRGTLDGLDQLVAADWVPKGEAQILADAYRKLRVVEHRLQMVQDAQTHTIPKDADGLRRLACFLGQGDPDAMVADLRATFEGVERIVDPAFQPNAPARPTETLPGADALAERWDTYPALRSDRARQILTRLKPGLFNALAGATRPEEALAAFDDFLKGLPAGVQVLSLFEANPKLVDLLAEICAVAPDLARYLSQHAGVLDAVIGGAFWTYLPDRYEAEHCDRDDFEGTLIALRRWHREAHFRIGVHLLRGLVSPARAGQAYADLACATLRCAWTAAEAETLRRYGQVPGLRVAGLGMGSLGAGQLNARSDLDLVVLHDGAKADAVSDGLRALAPAQWAAKFTQVLITALTAPMGEGRLYEVDMRLRPSGRQGPVATGLATFRAYQATEAWPWEHLALTRARPVAGDPATQEGAVLALTTVLEASRFAETDVVVELAAMRRRFQEAGRTGGGLAVKAGAGGLQDIELAAQAHALLARRAVRDVPGQLAAEGWLDAEVRTTLTASWRVLSETLQVLRLISAEDPPATLGAGANAFLARTLGLGDVAAVTAACDAARRAAAHALDHALAGATEAD